MPADRDPCPFGYNGDVGTSHLEEQLMERLHDPTPHSKEVLNGTGAGQFGRGSKAPEPSGEH